MKKILIVCFLLLGCGCIAVAQDQTIQGNLHIGPDHDAMGYSNGLYLRGNSDDFWFRRYNASPNISELRLNITDDLTPDDKFVIGTTNSVDGLWYPNLTLLNSGNLGLGVVNPSYRLDINGKLRTNSLPLIVGDDNASDHSIRFATFYDHSMSGQMRYINFGRNASMLNTGELAFNHSADNSSGNWVSLGLFGQNTQERLYVLGDGNVGIGTQESRGYKLSVNGKIRAQELKIEATNWPDYVFDDDYEITSLPEIKSFIDQNRHLPEMPSASTVEKEGVDVGQMNALLLKKIEELTLHLIHKDQQINNLEKRMKVIESQRISQ